MEPQRHPISVRLVGVMHKGKRKKQMKKTFPPASKLKKSDRIIPKFRYKRETRSVQKESPARSLVRLQFLQKYSNNLLSCDPRVCQCTELIQFFHPNQQELEPEFSKNSIMVMPSELQADLGSGNVTKPFVTETYHCVAAYETKDMKNKPFKVATDEKVDVLIKDKAGWWLVENDEKQMAWFPAPYLDKLEDDSEDGLERGTLYTAIKSYTATRDDEITVSIGAVVEALQQSDNGWWLVRYKEKAGYIPSVYLRSYRYPHFRLTPSLLDHQNSPRLAIPSLGQQFSRSQENLLVMPSSRPSSPHLLQPESKQKSRSLNILPVGSPTSAVMVPTFNVNPANNPVRCHPPPTITIQMDEDEGDEPGRSLENYRRGSFGSESDYSFGDDLSFSSGRSSPNLNVTEDQLCLSRTPQPPKSTYLSPSTSARMMPSVSDPNLYKGPASPKIPPRPKPQQIMARCTTITKKNAIKGQQTTEMKAL
uniref:NADPH oxidase organizer 1a n=1 Tax=Neogobius melanostomus TaxID=47308 RepID=A0A8C6TH87_9GOBI